ncbi:MAG: hypothetical protein MUE69_33385 [Myxococcota bacterium]|jgi:hypothetical protein|nr:hypothetical protein [Myxococcota bacterium]
MTLDLNAFDEQDKARLMAFSGTQRVAMGCWCCERLLPLYKQFRQGEDWKVVEPVVAAGWKYVAKGKVSLPRSLWDRAGELTSFYYFEGMPLVLFGVSSATSLLRAIKDAGEEYSATTVARAILSVRSAADEVDTVLGSAPRAADEARAWIESAFERLAAGAPLEPSGVDLETGAGLPEWWSDLVAHPNPVRRVKLD